MTNMIVADVAAATAATSQSSAGAQPSAQAVSRFEQQLQSPASTVQFYAAPLGEAVGVHGDWQAIMGDVGKISEQYRVDSMSVDGAPVSEQVSFSARHGADPVQSAQVFTQGMTKLSHMSYTMMSIGFVTSAERLAGENVRSLFQLA